MAIYDNYIKNIDQLRIYLENNPLELHLKNLTLDTPEKEKHLLSGSRKSIVFPDIPLENYSSDNNSYQILDFFLKEILPPLKYITFGELKSIIERNHNIHFPINSWENTYVPFYLNELPKYYLEKLTGKNISSIVGLDLEGNNIILNDHKSELLDLVTSKEIVRNDLGSVYYGCSKFHWLTNSLMKEGPHKPIIMVPYYRPKGSTFSFKVHPGNGRLACYKFLDNSDFDILFWDSWNWFPELRSLQTEDVLDIYLDAAKCVNLENPKLKFYYNYGFINMDIQSADVSDNTFRKHIWDHSKKITKGAANKPINIYIGYDSGHNDLEEVTKKAIVSSIQDEFVVEHGAYIPEIKFLDTSKIPEYTREDKDQSTAFTFSRFLIPYLENYEGYSIFLDDDIIFQRSILPLFYFLDPDDAVACVKYPTLQLPKIKFNGQANIPYDKKLWSSLMIFNNSHEDCKKLTPEAINTWSGMDLHQFKWTDKISEIPENVIFTEGIDKEGDKRNCYAYHYTRGGPWIDGQDLDDIGMLQHYYKYDQNKKVF